jgi:hypothetical protein
MQGTARQNEHSDPAKLAHARSGRLVALEGAWLRADDRPKRIGVVSGMNTANP